MTEEVIPSHTRAYKGPSSQTAIAKDGRLFDENKPKILVVDDEESVRELLRDLLESEGFRVHLAPGSREALGLFDANNMMASSLTLGCPE